MRRRRAPPCLYALGFAVQLGQECVDRCIGLAAQQAMRERLGVRHHLVESLDADYTSFEFDHDFATALDAYCLHAREDEYLDPARRWRNSRMFGISAKACRGRIALSSR